MTPGEPLIIGLTAGLILYELLCRALSWRELLTAMTAAMLIEIINLAVGTAAHSSGFAGTPTASPSIALAFIGILTALHMLRGD